jgi:hypothetical protein
MVLTDPASQDTISRYAFRQESPLSVAATGWLRVGGDMEGAGGRCYHFRASIPPGKTMYDENDLIYSPLQQKYTAQGKTVEVCIYRMPDTGWTLEVVDQYNNSIVWDGEFNTDQEAFDLFLEEVSTEGIEAMIGPEPGPLAL